jgi:HAD superfamily hydrolase (TIGR01484 family)
MKGRDEGTRMRPLHEMPVEAVKRVRGVLTDIDDTLTSEGRLTAAAYAAIERLADAGLAIVPITGRPAGWCDHIARMWPVAGVVGENGALWMRYDRGARRLVKRFVVPDAERAKYRARLMAIAARILAEVPGSALATDQLYRESDLAIDFCEDVRPLPREAVDAIVAIMQAEGMTAKVSSIHVNGWFGDYDKLGMTRTFASEVLGVDLAAERDRFVFAGDSGNDAPMFAYFPLSVGMANVRAFLDRLDTPPAFITDGESGSGFVELAQFVLAHR